MTRRDEEMAHLRYALSSAKSRRTLEGINAAVTPREKAERWSEYYQDRAGEITAEAEVKRRELRRVHRTILSWEWRAEAGLLNTWDTQKSLDQIPVTLKHYHRTADRLRKEITTLDAKAKTYRAEAAKEYALATGRTTLGEFLRDLMWPFELISALRYGVAQSKQ